MKTLRLIASGNEEWVDHERLAIVVWQDGAVAAQKDHTLHVEDKRLWRTRADGLEGYSSQNSSLT
jgi:hypothetical protein